MSDGGSRRTHVRVAAAVLATIIAAAAVFTYLGYTAAFTATDEVTVMSPRAGLVMEQDAKVKYRGILVGKVTNIEYAGDEAKLTLSIDSSQLRYIPSNAGVRIAGNTVFGAKSVEFLTPGLRRRAARCAPAPRCRQPRCSSRSILCSRRSPTCCTRSTRCTSTRR